MAQMMPVPGDLVRYLREAATLRFAWGAHDCATFAAGWVLLRTGCDPLAPIRGRYGTAWGCLRALRRQGCLTLEDMALRAARAARLNETAHPAMGDVGLVDIGPGHRPLRWDRHVLAIRTGDGWTGPSARGLRSASLPHLIAWRVP